jgi:peroxiredoxin
MSALASGCKEMNLSEGGIMGAPAPDFSLRDLSGQTKRFSDWRGKAVLLDFWAAWCGSCRESVPAYERIYQRFHEKNLVVLGIDEDAEPGIAATSARKWGISYPVLLDPRGRVFDAYGARTMPAVFLIDSSGTMRGRWEGFDASIADEIQKAVRAMAEP